MLRRDNWQPSIFFMFPREPKRSSNAMAPDVLVGEVDRALHSANTVAA